MPAAATLDGLFDEYLRFCFASDPIGATAQGVEGYDDQLGDLEPDAVAGACATRRDLLRRFEAVEEAGLAGPDPARRMDLQVALADLRTAVRRDEDVRVWARAPYWYAERLGHAYTDLMAHEHLPLEARGRALLARLEATGGHLAAAVRNLDPAETPALWAQMGIEATAGLQTLLRTSVPGFAERLAEALRADVTRAADRALEAVIGFGAALEDLHGRARGTWACGADHFDHLLRHFHLLDLDHDELHELGRAQLDSDRARLRELAAAMDPGAGWQELVARIKDDHPAPEEFLDSYGRELERSRERTAALDLAALPDGEVCRMGWVPDYLRASLPIGVMNLSPPFAPGLASHWLITPSDPAAPAERRLQQQRDNCYAFAASIAGHEIYPGHHLQRVHHKLGTADSPVRRRFMSPLLLEGWGLYVEDVQEESGWLREDGVRLFKARNALWRAVRVIVDTGLHTRGMAFEEAVGLLRDEAAMDTHMAEGEVRRYVRHDNPTYQSAYMMGRREIHRLRSRWRERVGVRFSYRDFHDRLLGYGTLPLRLIEERLLVNGSGSSASWIGA